MFVIACGGNKKSVGRPIRRSRRARSGTRLSNTGGHEYITVVPQSSDFMDSGKLVSAGRDFEGLKTRFLAGFMDSRPAV